MFQFVKNMFNKKRISLAEICRRASFTTDQLEDMGAKYQRLHIDSLQWGWWFPDGSKGFYENNIFKVVKDADY